MRKGHLTGKQGKPTSKTRDGAAAETKTTTPRRTQQMTIIIVIFLLNYLLDSANAQQQRDSIFPLMRLIFLHRFPPSK